MVKINLWSRWQEASATGWVWRCRKAELCCSWKLKTPSQRLPPWHDHTDQDGQHETGMQTCSAGRDPAPWVPISMWWRKGTCAQVHRSQTRLVWLLKNFFFSETKPFGAPYTSHFLPLRGAPALQFAALLSNQDTEDVSEGSCAPAADLQSQLAAPKEKYKAAHLLQDGIDLALLLLALESSPITCVWHQRNLFMPLVSLAGQCCQGNEKSGDFPIFRHVTGQIESKPWRIEFTGRTTGSLFPKHKLWPERDRNNQPVSAIFYTAALTAQQSTNVYNYQWEQIHRCSWNSLSVIKSISVAGRPSIYTMGWAG